MLRIIKSIIYIFVFLTTVSCIGGKQAELIPVQDFFGKPERTNFKVSPDGKKIAYVGLEDHCRNIFILDIEQPDSSKQLTYQNSMNVQYFFWASKDTIVYSNSQTPNDSLRLYTIDVHTERSTYLIPPSKNAIRWVSPTRSFDGKLLAQLNMRDSSVFDLYRIGLDGSGVELVERNDKNINTWFVSKDGKVRIAISSDSIEDRLWFRKEEDQPFKIVLETDFSSTLMPLGPVGNSIDSIYALSDIGRDKMAIVKMDLKSTKEEQLLSSSSYDLNKEGYLFSRGEMIYSTVNANKKQTKIHNGDFEKIYNKIANQFKGYAIDILDMDSAFNLVVFKTFTDINPGGVYYYSAKKDKIEELTITNPTLKDKEFAPMEEISFKSRDGNDINALITYPQNKKSNCPVVVLVHDGPNRRDTWGFNQEVQFLANRGYVVFQVNYRGSIGFGKKFYAAGFKQWGGEIQNDINDGVAWLIHKGIADKEKIAIMGSGFGGYSAMYAACFNPTMYRCAISSSGYLNLFTYFKEIPVYYKSYLQLYYKIIGDPIRESELFKAISPLFHAEKVKMPVLLFQGGLDKYNSITDLHQFVQKVKNNNVDVQYVFKEDEGKRFKKEENIIEYYQQIESFLNEQMK